MPEVHYVDHLSEQLRSDLQRLEQQLADTRDRAAFCEGRLRVELAEKAQLIATTARLQGELADAQNRLARCRAGGVG